MGAAAVAGARYGDDGDAEGVADVGDGGGGTGVEVVGGVGAAVDADDEREVRSVDGRRGFLRNRNETIESPTVW